MYNNMVPDCIVSPIYAVPSLPQIHAHADITIKVPVSGVVSYNGDTAMWIPNNDMGHFHSIFETQWIPSWEHFLHEKTHASVDKRELATQIWTQLFPTPALICLDDKSAASTRDARALLAFHNLYNDSSQISVIVRITVSHTDIVANIMLEAE
jgi:hypothetical protein